MDVVQSLLKAAFIPTTLWFPLKQGLNKKHRNPKQDNNPLTGLKQGLESLKQALNKDGNL